MSHIYIQEPRSEGKVILNTSVGDIELEFWPKECPKATRNFIQLCLEGYYNGTIFHRIVKDFIAVGGDPTGTGHGGESIYGKSFRDEFHSRLRFNRRGLLAMANLEKDGNNSQFFFTLGPATELQGKHTIFGKVLGDTLYNMMRLGECQVDINERPLNTQKIISVIVVENPFNDIVPRIDIVSHKDKKSERQRREDDEPTVGKKDFKLLSFGDETDEESEGDAEGITSKIRGKSKSSHIILDDPSLSAEPAIRRESSTKNTKDFSKRIDRDTKRVKTEPDSNPPTDESLKRCIKPNDDRTLRREEIQREFERIKKEINGQEKAVVSIKTEELADADTEVVASNLLRSHETYKMKDIPKKGSEDRILQTLAFLDKFKEKLSSNKSSSKKGSHDGELDEFLNHEFNVANDLVLARDANLKTADWYSIEDPRNPINKRRHQESSHRSSHHKSSRAKHKRD